MESNQIMHAGIFSQIKIPYARHYNPRFVYFLHPFFTAVYIVEWLIVLQTIYVLNKEILQSVSRAFSVTRFDYKGA